MSDADAYRSVVGGKLSLRGGVEKKKKKKKQTEEITEQAATAAAAAVSSSSTSSFTSAIQHTAGHTAAELRHIEKRAQRQLEKIERGEMKSHRDRVKDFNDYLGNLTEHYDLPKVSKGCVGRQCTAIEHAEPSVIDVILAETNGRTQHAGSARPQWLTVAANIWLNVYGTEAASALNPICDHGSVCEPRAHTRSYARCRSCSCCDAAHSSFERLT